mmetsp:Transcript_20838/g.36591  ORF Transcript_20838/g.36591 Transcript_20838/m.36591 type:complete len:96 (+) Transcript_20838:835-1122(+)
MFMVQVVPHLKQVQTSTSPGLTHMSKRVVLEIADESNIGGNDPVTTPYMIMPNGEGSNSIVNHGSWMKTPRIAASTTIVMPMTVEVRGMIHSLVL